MLAALSVRNIVLIEKLDLNFGDGLTVFTGETGAGKSIILDSLTLCLGARGDGGLVRLGANEGQVTARFELRGDHPASRLLAAQGFEPSDELMLRRVQFADGKTRAYLNDIPVTATLLRQVGQSLVEVHGQHDDRALTEPASHRAAVDLFGGLSAEVRAVSRAWAEAQSLATEADEAEAALEKARRDAEYLRHALGELETLAPQANEEDALAARRQALMTSAKLRGDLEDALAALSAGDFPSQKLNGALRRIERQPNLPDAIRAISAAIDRVLIEADEARALIEAELRKDEAAGNLDAIEDRLFRLRAAARKYRVSPAELPDLHRRFASEVENLDAGEQRVAALRKSAQTAAQSYIRLAEALSGKRRDAARKLDAAVTSQLKPLKLDKARFVTEIERLTTAQRGVSGGPYGLDAMMFHVQTNPGAKAGPLMKVASGGELARFILALKVVMANRIDASVLVFDEIDTGVGGATAAAIGQKLATLGESAQVIAVTHSPQVAAHADTHFRLFKTASGTGETISLETRAERLDQAGRREEIARMLAGVHVTEEARAAADRLIGAKP